MGNLTIPGDARRAGWEALERAFARNLDLQQVYACALEAAAPLIVAAELGRLAKEATDLLRRERAVCTIRASECTFCRDLESRTEAFTRPLLRRANELDPEGAQR